MTMRGQKRKRMLKRKRKIKLDFSDNFNRHKKEEGKRYEFS